MFSLLIVIGYLISETNAERGTAILLPCKCIPQVVQGETGSDEVTSIREKMSLTFVRCLFLTVCFINY